MWQVPAVQNHLVPVVLTVISHIVLQVMVMMFILIMKVKKVRMILMVLFMMMAVLNPTHLDIRNMETTKWILIWIVMEIFMVQQISEDILIQYNYIESYGDFIN